MLERRDGWVAFVLRFLETPASAYGRAELLAEALSEVKGLFSRSLKQDQWDWFLVFVRLGRPSRPHLQRCIDALGALRNALLGSGDVSYDEAIERARKAGLKGALETYKRGGAELEPGVGFVYVLSTRDQPDLLKIGYTERPIEQRVAEINRATGVVVPFGARGVWRVRDARSMESQVHQALAEHRVRSDREFFNVSYREASKKISSLIRERRLEPDME
jgi:hypothetical protein